MVASLTHVAEAWVCKAFHHPALQRLWVSDAQRECGQTCGLEEAFGKVPSLTHAEDTSLRFAGWVSSGLTE